MRVLITGGAGFIGSRLAWALVRDGHEVRVLDSLLPQVHGTSPALDLPPGEFIRADVRAVDDVSRAMRGIDAVYHLAAETGVGQSQYEITRYVSVNTTGTATVLEAAVHARVQHLVLASSRAVYGEGEWACASCDGVFAAPGRSAAELDQGRWEIVCPRCRKAAQPLPMTETTALNPTSIYGLTKLQQEQTAQMIGRLHGLPLTILRFFNVYGPGQSLGNPYVGVLGVFYRRATAGATIEVYEDGRMLRDFVFVDDVVAALRANLNAPPLSPRILNIGAGRAVTLHEVAEAIRTATASASPIALTGRYRLGDVRHTIAAVAREEFDYKPQTDLAAGVRAFVEWARATAAGADDALAETQMLQHGLLRRAVGAEK